MASPVSFRATSKTFNPPFLPPNFKRSLHLRRSPPPMSGNLPKLPFRASFDAEIHTHLTKSLPTSPPSAVTSPMLHLLSSAPKSLAPSLCLAACSLIAGVHTPALDAATAIHVIHAAASAHDRIPGLRGPGPDPHPFPAGVQLLTADGLLPLAYEIIARSAELDPEVAIRVVIEIAEAMIGAGGVVEEQLGRAEGDGGAVRSGGRLSACAAVCGAVVGGGGEEEVEKLRRCGMWVGLMEEAMKRRGSGDEAMGFRDRAMAELEGFEEERRKAVVAVVERWFEE